MAQPSVYRREEDPGEASFNMTPMIDVTFQLIIFFILTSQVASDELAQLVLHRPWKSPAQAPQMDERMQNNVIINVLSADADRKKGDTSPLTGRASGYKISGDFIKLGEEDEIGRIIEEKVSQAGGDPKNVSVEIRSDKRVEFAEVLPVMQQAMLAEIQAMHLTAKVQAKDIE